MKGLAVNSILVIHPAGCYVTGPTAKAVETAVAVGPVTIDVGNTACKVPSAADQIAKVTARGTLGTKRKTAKC